MTTNTINDRLNTETQKCKNAQLFEIHSRDICTLTPTKRPLSTIVCIEIQHSSLCRTTLALMLNSLNELVPALLYSLNMIL